MASKGVIYVKVGVVEIILTTQCVTLCVSSSEVALIFIFFQVEKSSGYFNRQLVRGWCPFKLLQQRLSIFLQPILPAIQHNEGG